jgi:hypothetical protein
MPRLVYECQVISNRFLFFKKKSCNYKKKYRGFFKLSWSYLLSIASCASKLCASFDTIFERNGLKMGFFAVYRLDG